jgi:hypothetical protein
MSISPCWIFSLPRSGSTFLCEILNLTGLFNPLFAEYFNSTLSKKTFVKNDFLNNYANYKFSKIQPLHFHVNRLSWPEVKKIFPDLKIIKLKRDNFFECVVSYCIAELNSIYTISENPEKTCVETGCGQYITNPNKFSELKINFFNDKTIAKSVRFMLTQKKLFDELLVRIDCLEVDYEEIKNKQGFEKIFQYLNINCCVEDLLKQSVIKKTPERLEKKQIEEIVKSIFYNIGLRVQ